MSLDFQGIGQAGFVTEEGFVKEFCRLLCKKAGENLRIPEEIGCTLERIRNGETSGIGLGALFDLLNEWCGVSDKSIVLIIDEVDSATNNQVFLDFLAQLRYIARDTDGIATFQSVILAGVSDIRHLRSKIRDEDPHKVNSPWNIAADFNIDMSLGEEGIQGMLDEYEADHLTGMDTTQNRNSNNPSAVC